MDRHRLSSAQLLFKFLEYAMGCGASTDKYSELAYEKFKHDAEDVDFGCLDLSRKDET